MNIIQAKHINDNVGKIYTYKVPEDYLIPKNTLMLAENKRTGKGDIVIATSNSAEVNDNVLNMIMQGKEVISSVVGIYWLAEFSNMSEGNDE